MSDTTPAGFTANFPGDLEHDVWEGEDDVLAFKTETFTSAVDGEIGVYTVRVHSFATEVTDIEGTKREDFMQLVTKGFAGNLIKLLAQPGWFRRAKTTLDEYEEEGGAARRRVVFEYRDRHTRESLVCYADYRLRDNLLYEAFGVVQRDATSRARAVAFLDSVTLR